MLKVRIDATPSSATRAENVCFSLITIALACACRSPTQIVLSIDSDAACTELSDVSVYAGDSLDSRSRVTTTARGNPVGDGCDVGTLVLTPSAARDAKIQIELVGGFGVASQDCTEGAPACVFARRSLAFIEHKSLEVPIRLYASCRGVKCAVGETCDKGVCVFASCRDSSNCQSPDGGAPDAGECPANLGDCDGLATNGCEVDLLNSGDHCGACGRACRTVTAQCSTGKCGPGACVDGFGNCNGVEEDGCETDLRLDASSCGSCGRDCDGTACDNGVCEPSVLGEASVVIFGMSVFDGYVYWTAATPPSIHRAPSGGGVPELVSPSPSTPQNLMVDSSGVYWTALNGQLDGSILKCTSVPCTAPTVLATSTSSSDSPRLAAHDGTRIYWSVSVQPTMRSVPKVGGSVAPVVQSGTAYANRGLALSTAERCISLAVVACPGDSTACRLPAGHRPF